MSEFTNSHESAFPKPSYPELMTKAWEGVGIETHPSTKLLAVNAALEAGGPSLGAATIAAFVHKYAQRGIPTPTMEKAYSGAKKPWKLVNIGPYAVDYYKAVIEALQNESCFPASPPSATISLSGPNEMKVSVPQNLTKGIQGIVLLEPSAPWEYEAMLDFHSPQPGTQKGLEYFGVTQPAEEALSLAQQYNATPAVFKWNHQGTLYAVHAVAVLMAGDMWIGVPKDNWEEWWGDYINSYVPGDIAMPDDS